jgi:hypothetical protein
MPSPRFLSALPLATVLVLASCNSSNQKTGSETDSASTTSTTAPLTNTTTTTPTSTIINTPQNMLLIRHKIANYAKWKMAYDGHDSARLANGIHSYVIGRGLQDSNMVMVALKVDDTTKAMAFAKDPGLKQAMMKGGVTGTPTINLVTMTFQDTAKISSALRSSVMFTVKDWDTWVKNFQEGNQERIDNGVVVRAYGHDAGDNHKARVVTALIDSAKAMAFFKSDMLKKRMEASGATSPPDRFLYRVVQRY